MAGSRTPLIVLSVGAVAMFAAAAAGALIAPEGPLRVELPARLESTATGDVVSTTVGDTIAASSGAAAIHVSRADLPFEVARPGTEPTPVEIVITNTGAAPLRIHVDATPFRNADAGAEIPASFLAVTFGAAGNSLPLDRQATLDGLEIQPGQAAPLSFRLRVPDGSEQYVPAGDYAGTIGITAEVTLG